MQHLEVVPSHRVAWCTLNKAWYLGTSLALDYVEEEVEILVQRRKKLALRVGVQTPNGLRDKVRIQLAEVTEIRRVRVECVAVHGSIIGTWFNWVGTEDIGVVANIRRCVQIASKKAVRHSAVLEEPPRNVEVKISRVVAAIDEERDREHGFPIGGEVPWGDEAELRVVSDRVLNALEPEFCRTGDVVKAASKLLAHGDELRQNVSLGMRYSMMMEKFNILLGIRFH